MDLRTLAQHVGELDDRDKEVILKLINNKETPVSISKGGLYYMTHQATSKGNLKNNICIAADKANLIKNKYKVNVINPLAIMNPETSWADSMDICYDLLSLVDGVILQEDFFLSTGCIYEALYAIENKIPVYIYHPLTDALTEVTPQKVIEKVKERYATDLKHRRKVDILLGRDKSAAKETYDNIVISRTLSTQPIEETLLMPRYANKVLFKLVINIITDNAWMKVGGEPITKVIDYGASFIIERTSIHIKKESAGYELEVEYDYNKRLAGKGSIDKLKYKFDTHGIILLYCAYASKRNQRVF